MDTIDHRRVSWEKRGEWTYLAFKYKTGFRSPYILVAVVISLLQAAGLLVDYGADPRLQDREGKDSLWWICKGEARIVAFVDTMRLRRFDHAVRLLDASTCRHDR